MNIELLSCRRLTAGLVYPPMPVQPSDLSRLYADMADRYPYQTLQHLPDGIRMANPDGDCLVQIGRTQINENVMYYQASKEKCVDVFKIIADRFNISQFMTFGLKLTAMLPMDSQDASSKFLDKSAFGLTEKAWNLLGPGRRGAGLRVVLHQDGVVDLKIEPFFNDTSELYVELDIQHPEPFNSINTIGDWMDQAYQYLFVNVKDFIRDLDRTNS
jgi:hypothetical protein